MLTGFNGTTISYDGAGNPTSYTNGKADYRFEWVKGRSLQYAAIMGDEQLQAFYKYDADGIRNFKDVDGMAHNYITQNGKVVRETIGSGSTAKILDFIYDESGKPFALKYSTNGGSSFGKYYYVLNLQGDVVKLVNTSGTVVANYTYNAWGEVLTATGNMASVNPLRYRGYYYDTETGFYYLQSRYYDPVTHRFINADSLASTGQGILGANMFGYVLNNPVILGDPEGTDAIVLFDSIVGVGHIGIMAQDKDGVWWHFYWGADGMWNSLKCAFNISVAANSWCVEYTGQTVTLDDINNSGQYDSGYEKMHYLTGDFSLCTEEMKNINDQYNLYGRNCSQVSLEILASSLTVYKQMLLRASKYTVPRTAFNYVKKQAAIIDCALKPYLTDDRFHERS